jgi:anti-sigma factor RsiW
MSCEEVAMRLSDALDGELSWVARLRLRLHLRLCRPCAETERSLRRTVGALRGMGDGSAMVAPGANERKMGRECD